MGNAFTPYLLILFISIEVLSFAYFRKNKSVVSGLSLSFIVSALLFVIFVLVLFGIIFRFGGFSWGF
jgi:hypothetical protein